MADPGGRVGWPGRWVEPFALLSLALGLSALLFTTRAAEPLDSLVYDTLVRATPHRPDPRILIVAIDDASLRQVGHWPWPRRIHADAVRRLSGEGALAVGYDVLFIEPQADDAALEAALRGSRTALPLLIRSPGDGQVSGDVVGPVVHAAALGHVVVRADRDGVFRRVALYEQAAKRPWPHLALATAQLSGGSPVVKGNLIRFAGPPGTFPSVSMAAVLRGEVPREFIAGHIVLVGSTAAGLGDRFATPAGSERDLMAGIEVQANIVDALLHGGLAESASAPARIAFSYGWLALLWLVFVRLTPRMNLAAVGAIVLMLLLTSAVSLSVAHVWLEPGATLIVIIIMFPFWGWRRLAFVSRYLEHRIAQLGGPAGEAAAGADLLGRQIAALDAATTRVDLLHRQRDNSLAFLSHDLRSPAAAILGIVDQESKDPGERRIAGHAARMLHLADQFVQAARAEEAPLAIERIDLAEAIEEAADFAWESAQQHGSVVSATASPDMIFIDADRTLLARALGNLIDNAIRYGSPRSTVRVRAWAASGQAWLTVADTGAGIAVEKQATLFGRYDRGDSSRTDSTGLGLALVATFAGRHHGTVGCLSRVGVGSVFRLVLPLAAPDGAGSKPARKS